MELASKYSEKQLQRLTHAMLSDPSIIRNTIDGKRIQVLSPGTINDFEGPDFIDVAIMLNSQLIIGDAEFHKHSSDWHHHKHNDDERYKRVILHIVLDNNAELPNSFETLLVSQDELLKYANKKEGEAQSYPQNIEALHQYSLNRILRKTAESKKVLNSNTLNDAVYIIINNFINRYLSMRRRPVYDLDAMNAFLQNMHNTRFMEFILNLNASNFSDIPDKLITLLKDKECGLGTNFRREIVLNCILPISLAISGEEARINLFLWYWSTPALSSYGILKRKFPDFPQNFLWQQQGMLEYNSQYGPKSNSLSEQLPNYGLGEILDFYHIGQNPYLFEK